MNINDLMVFYENAIAINNVRITCREGKISGVFGANSAGKTTLMLTISGIILELKKRGARQGGERITVMGSIRYDGRDILRMETSERARLGIVLCPERRRIFPESSALENLKIGGYLASRAQAKKTLEYVFTLFRP